MNNCAKIMEERITLYSSREKFYPHDYALLLLNEEIGNKVGYVEMGCPDSDELRKTKVSICGFPKDKNELYNALTNEQRINGFAMNYDDGQPKAVDSDRIY
ncbi:MAG: hypothetical protein HQK52_16535 [Oligoflexia bacterium]|nr:hypothetical protein [Oligoflexia bacterium]